MNPTTPKISPASLHRRKVKIARMTGAQRSKCGSPTTPLLQWKLEDKDESVDNRGGDRLQFPARKLAAALWQFHYKEIAGGGVKVFRRGTHNRRGYQGRGEVSHRHRRSRNGRAEAEHRSQSPRSFAPPKQNNGIHHKAVATKWDAETPETASQTHRFYSHKKHLEEQPFITASVVTNLKTELSMAQRRIRKLESQKKHSKKKVEHLKGKHEENWAVWKSKKLSVVANELDHEKKTRHKVEILNASLVKELADAKLYARKYKQEYEKEKKSRELMEEVCEELAKQIVEDKAKVDALKVESSKLYEEMEEERKMLQMAEVWREERIQMKLIDAKLALEDKYVQMNKLITDLENFLVSRSEKLDVIEFKRAELFQQAAKSVKIEDIESLFYEPQTHNLMLSLLENLKQASNFKEIEECIGYADQDLKIPNSSFRLDSFDRSPEIKHNADSDQNIVGNNNEEAGQNSSPVHQAAEEVCVSESKSKCVESPCVDSVNRVSEITEQKTIDESSGRSSNRAMASEGGLKGGDSVSQRWRNQETVNPRFRRGAQGCIEWPRGIQRNCFKTKALDARIESQKSQIRHILKHRVK